MYNLLCHQSWPTVNCRLAIETKPELNRKRVNSLPQERNSNWKSWTLRFRQFSHGTQQPIALLKLLFEKGGTFSRDKVLNWKYLKDILYYGVVTVPGGGQIQLDKRFVSLCAIFNVMTPNEQTIFAIFQSILSGHLANFATELLPISNKLINLTHKLLQVLIASTVQHPKISLNQFFTSVPSRLASSVYHRRHRNSTTHSIWKIWRQSVAECWWYTAVYSNCQNNWYAFGAMNFVGLSAIDLSSNRYEYSQ